MQAKMVDGMGHLSTDVLITPGLVVVDSFGVAMHWVTDPGHHLAGLLDHLNQGWQLLPQVISTHADDDADAAGGVSRVQCRHEPDKFTRIHLVGDLQKRKYSTGSLNLQPSETCDNLDGLCF